jgi:hypothetical protein
MQTHPTWAEWFTSHTSNDAENKNLQAFSDILSAGVSNEAKLRDLVDEIDSVILGADPNKNIMIFHSPKNYGGTRSRPELKVSCMLGLGARATPVLLDLNSAFANI